MDEVNAVGHIDNAGGAELTWGGIADGNNEAPAQGTGAPVSCATAYCHDASKIKNAYGGADTTGFAWENPDFIDPEGDDVYVGVGDCDSCHGYPPQGTHASYGTDCSACHNVLNADDVSFTPAGKSTHVDGVVQASGGDSCSTCHVTLSGDHDDHVDYDYFLAGKTLSGGDYGKATPSGTNNIGWYDVAYSASSLPIIGCGQCHPNTQVSHPSGGSREIDLDGSDELASLPDPNPKRNNAALSDFLGDNTCSGVYCHSDGNNDGTYPNSPTWATDTITDCKGCHGNSPSDAVSGTHGAHAVGIHSKTLYDGTNSLMTEGDIAGSGAAHGDSATSDPINCQTCHINTVVDTFNSRGSSCATACHASVQGDSAAGDEWMGIKPSSSAHIDGAKSVFFDTATFKSKAQVREAITDVPELTGNWTRSGAYKASDSFDQASNAAAPSYDSGNGSCSNIDCHNGNVTPDWRLGFQMACNSCHTSVPQ